MATARIQLAESWVAGWLPEPESRIEPQPNSWRPAGTDSRTARRPFEGPSTPAPTLRPAPKTSSSPGERSLELHITWLFQFSNTLRTTQEAHGRLRELCEVLTGMTRVHVVLGAIHPVMEASIPTMLTGGLPEEYVVSHQAKWYEQIRRRVGE